MPYQYAHLIVSTFLIVLISACLSKGDTNDREARTQVYIDANLLFEVSYPEEMVRRKRPVSMASLTKQTTTWNMIDPDTQNLSLELIIVSIPAERNPHGYAGLETILFEQNQELTILTSEQTSIAAGAARKLVGERVKHTYELWLHTGEKRHYIISCAATTKEFDQYRSECLRIIESFKTLD